MPPGGAVVPAAHAAPTGMAAAGNIAQAGGMPAGVPAAPPQQATGANQARVYTLKFARAQEVQPAIAHWLNSASLRGEVAIDPTQNVVIVHGGEDVQRLAADVVQSIDRAAEAQLGPPTLQTYPAAAAQLEPMCQAIRDRFGPYGARVAADARNEQLLVVAPAAMQTEIAKFVGVSDAQPAQQQANTTAGAGGSQAQPIGPKPATPRGANFGLLTTTAGQGQIMQLRTSSVEVQKALKRLYGPKLVAAAHTNRDVAVYTLDVSPQERLRIEFDMLTGQVAIHGEPAAAERCARLLAILEAPQAPQAARKIQVVPLGAAAPGKVFQVATLLEEARQRGIRERGQTVRAQATRSPHLVAQLFQPPAEQAQPGAQPPQGNQPQPAQPQGGAAAGAGAAAGQALPQGQMPPQGGQAFQPGQATVPAETEGLVGPVQVEVLEDLGVIILRGPREDVDRLIRIIEQIEERSQETEPEIRIHPLEYVNGEALATIVRELYDSVYAGRKGRVSITPLIEPNALLLIGPPASVEAATDLIRRLDTPSGPESQFEVFRLKYASAQAAAATLQQFYGATPGPGAQQQGQAQQTLPGLFPRVNVIADYRTNALIVRASPRDLAEIAHLLSRIDIDSSPSELSLKVFQLRNALADDLAAVLQAAITGTAVPGQQQIGPQLPGVQQQPGVQGQQAAQRSAVLRLMTLDARDRTILRSGILTDVQVTADPRANSLVVRAPADSMPLIEALIEQLDNIPGATAQIKVFTIVNGDAESLVGMLSTLFGATATGGQFGAQQATSIQADGSIVPLRFAVDSRTNSILATGSSSDLTIVEAVLLRLDESDVRERETQVYRLKNAPALDVANSINQLLQAERAVQEQGVRSAFQQIQEEVVVVGEPVTNSLIVTATPRYFDEIRRIIDELDRRPPMVMIQVLIAEVQLNNTDEFGVELGLQDSILFDRSLLGDLITTTASTQTPQGNTVVTTTNQIIQGASLTPGYLFNNQPLGNSGSDLSRATSGKLAGQALSSFSVGRVNSQLGYGGLVLSASSESISILIRALQECRRLDVLARPQVMTLDNQPAFIQVGQRVQLITATTFDQVTGIQTNQLGAQQNVGLILGVTPRISPDGLVVMEIDVEKSEVGPESEGIPVSVLPTGDVIRSPRINTTLAQSTVSALSGQTIVLGGLITKTKAQTHRRVPLLASIPVLGHLFRYDANVEQRTELLIIMTPRVVRTEEDMEMIKQIESARMHWVLSDVRDIHGDTGLRGRGDAWEDAGIPVIYPHINPDGKVSQGDPELAPGIEGAEELLPTPMPVPTPAQQPRNLPPVPTPEQRQQTVPPDPVPPGQVPPGTTPAGPPPGAAPAAGASVPDSQGGSTLQLMPAAGAALYPPGQNVQPATWQQPVGAGPGQSALAAQQEVRLISPSERAEIAQPQPQSEPSRSRPKLPWKRGASFAPAGGR